MRRTPRGAANVATGRETTVLELGSALGLDLDRAEERAGEVRRSCLARSLRGRAAARLDGPRRGPRGLERSLAAMRVCAGSGGGPFADAGSVSPLPQRFDS